MRRRRVGVAVAVAVVLAVAPVLVWPNYGQTPWTVEVSPAQDPDDADVVAYENLSPTEQRAFEEARGDGSATVYVENDDGVRSFQTHGYVRYEGETYAVSSTHADGAWLYVTVLRYLLFGGAAVALLYAGREAWRRRSDAPW